MRNQNCIRNFCTTSNTSRKKVFKKMKFIHKKLINIQKLKIILINFKFKIKIMSQMKNRLQSFYMMIKTKLQVNQTINNKKS